MTVCVREDAVGGEQSFARRLAVRVSVKLGTHDEGRI